MPQRLEPRARLALFYGPDEVRRRIADYSRKGREHDERYEREHGERPELFDQEFFIDLGARLSELEACQDLAKLTDPQAACAVSRLVSGSETGTQDTRAFAESDQAMEICQATDTDQLEPDSTRTAPGVLAPKRRNIPQAKSARQPTTPIPMHEGKPMHTVSVIDSDTSGFFENPNAIPSPPQSNLKPVTDAGQFLSIFDEMRARQRAEEEAREREAVERQARSVAQLARRQRDEALEMARGALARFAETLKNIEPALPVGTREDLMVRTLIAKLDAFAGGPPDASTNVLPLLGKPRAVRPRHPPIAKERP